MWCSRVCGVVWCGVVGCGVVWYRTLRVSKPQELMSSKCLAGSDGQPSHVK